LAQWLVVCSATLLVLLSAPSARAQDSGETMQEFVQRTTSWMIYFDVEVLKQYLNYPGTQFAEPAVVRVTYQIRGKEEWGNRENYEDLWFHNGTPLGQHRYRALPRLYGDGVILVNQSPALNSQARSVARALPRILLDIIVSKSILRSVYLPDEIYGDVVNELSSSGFKRFTLVRGGTRLIMLHIESFPSHNQIYMYYAAATPAGFVE
jgi:hypothetical protein